MILFICSQGKLRSRTAELLCLFGGLYAKSAGTDASAEAPISDALLRQATLVVCMENAHKQQLAHFMHYGAVPTVTLGIPDEFNRLEYDLCQTLCHQMSFHDKAAAEAMLKGWQFFQNNPDLVKLYGTHDTPSHGNTAYSIFPSY